MRTDRNSTFNRFISIISRCGQIYFDRELSPMNIGSGQIRILRALNKQDGINQERIRYLFHLDKGTVAKAVKPLIREGYITRKKDPDDKRAYKISLTDKGRDIIPKLNAVVHGWAEILTEGFSETEKQMVDDLLARMSEKARNQLTRKKETRQEASSK